MMLRQNFVGSCFAGDTTGSMRELTRQLPTSFITSTSSARMSQAELESEGLSRTHSAFSQPRRVFSFFFRRASADYEPRLRSRDEQPKSDSSIFRMTARSSRNSNRSLSRKSSLFLRRHHEVAMYQNEEDDANDLPPWHSSFKPIPNTSAVPPQVSPTSSVDIQCTPNRDVQNQDEHSSSATAAAMNHARFEIPRPTSVKDDDEDEISFIREIMHDDNSLKLQQPVLTEQRRVSMNVKFDNDDDGEDQKDSGTVQRCSNSRRRASISTSDDAVLKKRFSITRQRSPMSPRRFSIGTPDRAHLQSLRLSLRRDSSSRPGKSKSARSSLETKSSSSRQRPSTSGGIDDLPRRRYTESDANHNNRHLTKTRTFFTSRRRRSVQRDREQTNVDPHQHARETFARSRNLALIWRTNASAGGGMHGLDAFQRALVYANDTRGLGRLLRALCATLPQDTPGLHRDSLWRAADLAANFVSKDRPIRPLPLYTTTNRFLARAPFGDALALVAVAASAHGSLGVRRLVRRTSRVRRLFVSLTLRNSKTFIRIDLTERSCGAEHVEIAIVTGNMPIWTHRRDLIASLRGSLAYLGIHAIEGKPKYLK